MSVPKDHDLNPFVEALVPKVPAAPVPPSLAFACLKSVPLNKEEALGLLTWLRPYFGWQSTLDHVRDPPRGYLSEAVDMLGGLDEIGKKLNASAYSNEFEFMADLYTLANIRVRDAHFSFLPSLLDLFTFRSGVQFVSISSDGLLPPQIFLHGTLHSSPPDLLLLT